MRNQCGPSSHQICSSPTPALATSSATSLAMRFGMIAKRSPFSLGHLPPAKPHCCYSSAAQGNAVVILCNRRALDSKPPFLSQGLDPSSQIFRRIQVKYVDDDERIKNYFAAFHLHPTFPASIIVDNFGHFFDERNCQERYNNPRGRDLAIIRALALCRNVISHANKTSRCEILLSDTHKGESSRLLYIYKRWVDSIYTIKGNGSGSFVLRKSYSGTLNAKPTTSSANYSIALQSLVLEGFVEETDRPR